jgi:hypothetical protein
MRDTYAASHAIDRSRDTSPSSSRRTPLSAVRSAALLLAPPTPPLAGGPQLALAEPPRERREPCDLAAHSALSEQRMVARPSCAARLLQLSAGRRTTKSSTGRLALSGTG